MMNPSIKDAKDAKRVLQSTIALALRQFSDDTGLIVDSVNIDSNFINKIDNCFYQASYKVQVEVKL